MSGKSDVCRGLKATWQASASGASVSPHGWARSRICPRRSSLRSMATHLGPPLTGVLPWLLGAGLPARVRLPECTLAPPTLAPPTPWKRPAHTMEAPRRKPSPVPIQRGPAHLDLAPPQPGQPARSPSAATPAEPCRHCRLTRSRSGYREHQLWVRTLLLYTAGTGVHLLPRRPGLGSVGHTSAGVGARMG